MNFLINSWSAENLWFRFCYFAKQGHLLPMKLILDQSIDYETVEVSTGNTPLVLAAQNNQLATMSFLLRKKANINSTASYNGITAFFRC